jgi:hypothetical protein
MSSMSLPLNPVIENKQFDVLYGVKGKSLAEKGKEGGDREKKSRRAIGYNRCGVLETN